MYILITEYENGTEEYLGPFRSRRRANAYGHSMMKFSLYPPQRWFVKELVRAQ